MGKITREELAHSLNDHIESQSKNKQNKTDDNLKTSDKTIVGAINELYQDINDGKQIIADAINNDSITKDSPFEAMGESIRGLSTKVNSLTNELAGKVTPAGTAIANDVLSGKTFINNTGHIITGTIADRGGAQTVTPGTSNKTLSAGYYSGNITVAGSTDLVAANIISGKNIFGVAGTATADSLGGRQFETGTVTASGGSRSVKISVGFTPSLIMGVHVDDDGFPLISVCSKYTTCFTCRINGTCTNTSNISSINGNNVVLALKWSSYYTNSTYTITWYAFS
jgi:hypothetical protein